MRMEVVDDCRRATMQAEYEVYRKMTATRREMVIILPGTRWASTVMPTGKTRHFTHRAYVFVLFSSNNKYRFFPLTFKVQTFLRVTECLFL